MPCPHFKITITQRSRGQSAVAGAAYQSGEKLYSEYDRKTKSYSEKKGIVYTEIMLPPNAPPEYSDRNTLWNAAEKTEKSNHKSGWCIEPHARHAPSKSQCRGLPFSSARSMSPKAKTP